MQAEKKKKILRRFCNNASRAGDKWRFKKYKRGFFAFAYRKALFLASRIEVRVGGIRRRPYHATGCNFSGFPIIFSYFFYL